MIQVLGHIVSFTRRPSVVLDDRGAFSVFCLWEFLSQWDRSASLFQGFSPTCSWNFLVRTDASTRFGLGGLCFPSGLAFSREWTAPERSFAFVAQRESSTCFELLAVLFSICTFGETFRRSRVQFELDSETGQRDLCRGFSAVPACLRVLHCIRILCASFCIVPRFEHVKRVFNPIADCLANGNIDQANVLFARVSPLSAKLIVIPTGLVPDHIMYLNDLHVQEFANSFQL